MIKILNENEDHIKNVQKKRNEKLLNYPINLKIL